jgi:hypothetical protein
MEFDVVFISRREQRDLAHVTYLFSVTENNCNVVGAKLDHPPHFILVHVLPLQLQHPIRDTMRLGRPACVAIPACAPTQHAKHIRESGPASNAPPPFIVQQNQTVVSVSAALGNRFLAPHLFA